MVFEFPCIHLQRPMFALWVALSLSWNDGPPALSQEPRVVNVHDREGLLRAAAVAEAGTRIALAPGTYRGGLHIRNLRGRKGKPLVLESRDRKRPATIRGGTACLHLSDPVHVVLRNLTFEGASANGINIDDGGSFETPAHDVILEGLTVRNVGPRGNRDGIKLSGVTAFRVENCRVEQWGDGGSGIDMVGCHSGVIVACTFRHDEPPSANGVQMKGGSRDIEIRHCRFERVGGRSVNIGGSTGLRYFRPRPEGFEAKGIVVEDSAFVGSAAPIAFVGVDGAIVRHNAIYRPTRWVLRILQETRSKDFVPCRRGRFVRNIIAYRTDEVRAIVNVGPETAPRTFEFRGNVWYALDAPERSHRAADLLPVREKDGVYGTDPRFIDAERGRFELTPDSPVRGAGPRSRSGRPPSSGSGGAGGDSRR